MHDGREVDSWSAEWQLECLARYCWKIKPGYRVEWLNAFSKGRPEQFLEALRVRMRSIQEATIRGSRVTQSVGRQPSE